MYCEFGNYAALGRAEVLGQGTPLFLKGLFIELCIKRQFKKKMLWSIHRIMIRETIHTII